MYIYVYICIYLYMYIYILNIITIYQHFCWWKSPLRHHVFTCGVLEPPEMSKSIEGWDPAGELFCGADFLGMGTRWDGNFQGTLTRKEGRIDFLVFQCFHVQCHFDVMRLLGMWSFSAPIDSSALLFASVWKEAAVTSASQVEIRWGETRLPLSQESWKQGIYHLVI